LELRHPDNCVGLPGFGRLEVLQMTAAATQPPSLLRRLWREWVRPLLTVAIVLTSLRSAVADWNDVPSGSMEPTLLIGDRIFVNRLAYDLKVPFTTWHLASWADPQRGDVVVLESPIDGTRLVKRVVAVPGDEIEVRRQRLYVNGQAAAYAPASDDDVQKRELAGMPEKRLAFETVAGRRHMVMASSFDGPGSEFGPVRLPAGQYFVMGDHRDTSYDSRFWGFAERRLILGRALAVAISLDYGHHFAPRWRRFGLRLE
jgi:signal peptidase I